MFFRQDNGTVAKPRIQCLKDFRKWATKAEIGDRAEAGTGEKKDAEK